MHLHIQVVVRGSELTGGGFGVGQPVARHREHDGVVVCWNSGGVSDAGEAGREGGCGALHALNDCRGGEEPHCTWEQSRVEEEHNGERRNREERAFGRL